MNFRALLLSSFLALSNSAVPKEKVAVVGGGLAGLTAAYRLQQLGYDVELYEARNRVGGRVLSAMLDGRIAELGAESINDGGEGLNIRRLISEMGLEVVENHLASKKTHCFVNGKLIPRPYFSQKIDEEELYALAKNAHSMGEILDALVNPEDPLHKIISLHFAGFEGAPPEKLAPVYLETLIRNLQPEMPDSVFVLSSVLGGNSLLPLRLAATLGNRLHLGYPLVVVEKTENGSYRLQFANGEEREASILVLAIPCSIYEDIAFDEAVIPPEKLAAIRKVCYGTNSKILVPFPGRKTLEPCLANQRAFGWFEPGRELLTLYYTRESSRFSSDSLQATYNMELPMIQAWFGPFEPHPLRLARDEAFASYEGTAVGYSWPQDPYSKGSYSYIAPGQETLLKTLRKEGDEWVKELFSPLHGTLYFAGEHATVLLDVPGTMEAACESGERAARMIHAQRDASLQKSFKSI